VAQKVSKINSFKSLFESSVFKIPETANIHILTYSDIKSPEDEFYTPYAESDLKGLTFEMLYSE
jgi:hypothetical protein